MDFFPDGGKSSAQGCEKLIQIKDDDHTGKLYRIKRFLFNKNNKNPSNSNGNDEDEDEVPRKNFLQKLRDGIGHIRPLKKVFLNIHAYIGCNHLRSPHYFISSINQCGFRAKLCSSWSDYLQEKCNDPIDNNLTYPRMGFHAHQSDPIYRRGNGSFYLKTKPEPPYCSPSSLSSIEKKSEKKTSLKSKLKKKISKLLPKNKS